jgi:PDDEXK-like domain of unknown function (DUF3799)
MDKEALTARPMVDPDGVRFSRLKLMAESPMHYLANVHGTSATLDRGTAVHSILLGGKRVCYYDKTTEAGASAPRRGKDWEAFKALHEGETILSASEYETSNRIADAVRVNSLAMQALTGVCEQTLRFDWMGLTARSTPDVRANDGTFLTELKTCRSSRPGKFAMQGFWMHYHAQMAFHAEAMRRNDLWRGKVMPEAFIVAVCSAAPYPVTVFKLTPRAMEQGLKSIVLWTEQLKQCISSRHFPAYSQAVVDFDVPDNDGPLFADGETESQDVAF